MSGFSFMGAGEVEEEDDAASASGFSFMSPAAGMEEDETKTVAGRETNASNDEGHTLTPIGALAATPVSAIATAASSAVASAPTATKSVPAWTPPSQPLTMASSAGSTVRKKKKRVAVGIARQEQQQQPPLQKAAVPESAVSENLSAGRESPTPVVTTPSTASAPASSVAPPAPGGNELVKALRGATDNAFTLRECRDALSAANGDMDVATALLKGPQPPSPKDSASEQQKQPQQQREDEEHADTGARTSTTATPVNVDPVTVADTSAPQPALTTSGLSEQRQTVVQDAAAPTRVSQPPAAEATSPSPDKETPLSSSERRVAEVDERPQGGKDIIAGDSVGGSDEGEGQDTKATSASDELAQLLEVYQQEEQGACAGLCGYGAAVADLAETRTELDKECLQTSESLSATEAKQTALAEAEDYEGAEALSATLEALEAAHAAATKRLDGLSHERSEAMAALAGQRAAQQTRLAVVVEQLEALRDRQRTADDPESETDATAFAAGAMSSELAAEAERLEAEKERLATERSSVARERANVASEREEYESQISKQTESENAVKTELLQQLEDVSAEIEELEKTLAAKKAAKSALQRDLEGADAKIQRVRTKFERQLQRISDREDMLQRTEGELEEEESALEEDQTRYADAVAEDQAQRDAAARVLQDVENELAAAGRLRAFLLYEGRERASMENDAKTLTFALASLREELKNAETACADAAHDAQGVTHTMAALRSEKAGIAERLPQLDRSKKAASKGRNFKEAGALSKEMKQLEQRRSEVEAEMDELIPRLAELEDAQAATDARRSECAARLGAANDGLDAMRLEWLKARALNLEEVNAESFNDGDKDGAGGPKSDSGVLAATRYIVAAELDLTQSEIAKLEAKLNQ